MVFTLKLKLGKRKAGDDGAPPAAGAAPAAAAGDAAGAARPPPAKAARRAPPGVAPARAVPGGAPARAVPGGAPVRALPGGAPVRAVPGGAPARALPGGAPVRALPGGAPARAIPGGAPARAAHTPGAGRARAPPKPRRRGGGAARPAVPSVDAALSAAEQQRQFYMQANRDAEERQRAEAERLAREQEEVLRRAAAAAAEPEVSEQTSQKARGRSGGRRGPRARPAPSPAPRAPAAPKPQRDRGFKAERAAAVIASLARKDKSSVFLKEVRAEDVPGYYDVIKEAMSFDTIRAKFKKDAYTTWQEVKDDVDLMCNNAMYFNAPSTFYHTAAKTIYEAAQSQFKNCAGRALPVRRGACLWAGDHTPAPNPLAAEVGTGAAGVTATGDDSVTEPLDAGATGGGSDRPQAATPEPSTMGPAMSQDTMAADAQGGGAAGSAAIDGEGGARQQNADGAPSAAAAATAVPLVFRSSKAGTAIDFRTRLDKRENRRRTYPKPPSVLRTKAPTNKGPAAAEQMRVHQAEKAEKAALERALSGERVAAPDPAARAALARVEVYEHSLMRFARGMGSVVQRVAEEMRARVAGAK